MTQADPHGQPADSIRSCYASWMNTPDAGRIRVRWYRLPDLPPGTYELSDYSSSNFDADNLDTDPPAGEESSTRDPFRDWRDCCPPPWFDALADQCPALVTPAALAYTVPALTLQGLTVPLFAWPARTMVQTSPCTWTAPQIQIGTLRYTPSMFVQDDGTVTLRISIRQGIGVANVSIAVAGLPTDMTQPIVFGPFITAGVTFVSPYPIVVKPAPPAVLGSDDCTGFTDHAGAFLLAT